jgi:hypothetical protein
MKDLTTLRNSLQRKASTTGPSALPPAKSSTWQTTYQSTYGGIKPQPPSAVVATYQSAYPTKPQAHSSVVSVAGPKAGIPSLPVKYAEATSQALSASEEKKRGTSRLKQVLYPKELIDGFVSFAAPNTRKHIETCGLLCGVQSSTMYMISQVVIPPQTGTADTCAMFQYDKIAKYAHGNKLLVLGWIHTHPDYACCFIEFVDVFLERCGPSYTICTSAASARVYCNGVLRSGSTAGGQVKSASKQGVGARHFELRICIWS